MSRSITVAPRTQGKWDYAAGASGTRTITGASRVLCIAAHSTAGGTMTINGGDSIPIPANTQVTIEPVGNLSDPVIVFTGTDSYFVEFLR